MPIVANTRPNLIEADIRNLAEGLFGLDINILGSLPSERDQNFYIKDNQGQEFVLKIAASNDDRELVEMQNKAMIHLANHIDNPLFPRVCSTKSGDQITETIGANEQRFFVRLMSYLQGSPFAETRPHSPELLRSLGTLLGNIDRELQTFSHTASQRELKWDLKIAGWIRDYTSQIARPERRAIVEHFLRQFDEIVMPALPTLRSSVIHNDPNDYNILVQTDDSGNQRIAGLIDFGDMVHSYTICELAVALAYAMLGKPDPLAAAAQIISGYHTAYPLTEKEIEVLFHLVCMRLSVSVTNSAREQIREPDNKYLTISEKPAWDLLEKLFAIDPALAHYTFRDACGFDPCPKTAAVVNWLKTNQDQIGPVVGYDLAGSDAIVFDLSAGSQDIDNLSEIPDTPAFSRKLFKLIADVNASVGIGKYDEARLLYISDLFKSDGNDGPKWRTVHLGIDLFLPAGSSVLSPLEGKIHSFRNNAGLLDYGPAIIIEHEFDDVKFYTLYGHLCDDSLEGLFPGKPIKRGEQIARIGNYPTNGNWPPHVHFQIITDMLGRDGEFPGVALPSEKRVWLSISPDPNLILKIPPRLLNSETLSETEILNARQKNIGPSLSISYKRPLTIVRGSMQYLYDDTGRKYLDAVNNVPHVGHCHPKVVRAAQRQMAVLNTNTRYLHENLVRYAERLCATLPEPLSVCYFVCSGSEANELALRLARAHTKRKDIIVVDGAYHGNTNALVEISPYKFDGPGGPGAPDYVHKIAMPDPYRGPYKSTDPNHGKAYAQSLQTAIEMAERNGRKIGAFICESLLSCGGQIVLPDGYLKTSYGFVRNTGGVCIADEVQVGFARVGSHFWGFETQDVVPDIVTMGKPIGNGHPMAAVVTTPKIAASFNNGMEYFNTFGGNPVSCAIGMAVLDVIEEEKLQENALKTGNRLKEGLVGLMSRHKLIGDVRGMGLFVGVELVLSRETLIPSPRQAGYIAERMKDRGILISTDGPLHNVLKIKPPLVISLSDVDYLINSLDQILKEDFLQID